MKALVNILTATPARSVGMILADLVKVRLNALVLLTTSGAVASGRFAGPKPDAQAKC